jgi:hypothetical protein
MTWIIIAALVGLAIALSTLTSAQLRYVRIARHYHTLSWAERHEAERKGEERRLCQADH